VAVFFESTDVEAAYDTLSSLYGIRRFAAPGMRPFVRIDQDKCGPVDLHRLTFGMTCESEGSPLGVLYFGHVLGGTLTYRHSGGSHTYRAGGAYLAGQPGEAARAVMDNADFECVGIGVTLLDEVAGTTHGRRPPPVRFTGYQPATPAGTRLWLQTHQFVRDQIRHQEAAATPLFGAAAAELLAATALSVFPNNARTGPTTEDRRDAHPATLRRAVAFIDENAHRDITTADIAAAAFVTPRAVQLAFQRHLGATPTAYLRRVRLDHAHQDLKRAGPGDGLTVAAVAYRWGFGSSSRFAAAYQRAYGVSPNRTLRRGWQ
jgi:AraC-like DNA-binding protein